MHVLPQEIGLDSFSTYKNSMYGVNDNVPDNEDLLDFLVHLHDDALDLSEAPVQPSSKTSVYSTCKDSNTNLRYGSTPVLLTTVRSDSGAAIDDSYESIGSHSHSDLPQHHERE